MAIFDLIKSGSAFANPLSPAIAAAQSWVDGFSTDTAYHAVLMSAENAWSQIDIDEFSMFAQDRVRQVMQDIQGHSNKLAGIDFSDGFNLLNIMNVANASKGATSDTTCNEVIGAFGTLLQGALLIAGVVELLTNLDKYAPAIARSLANAALDRITQSIASDIARYQNALTNAIFSALDSGLQSLLGDNCFALIIGNIATGPLRREIQQKTLEGSIKISGAVQNVLSKRV